MTPEKQIEDITHDLCEIHCKGMKCATCDTGCEFRIEAEALYNAGYRKASDVAAEIFAEIEKLLIIDNFRLICNRIDFAELKKKWEVEE